MYEPKTRLTIHDDLRYLPVKNSTTPTPTNAPELSTTVLQPTSSVEPETNSDTPVTPEPGNTEPSGSTTTNIQQPTYNNHNQLSSHRIHKLYRRKGDQPERRENPKDYHTMQTGTHDHEVKIYRHCTWHLLDCVALCF